MDKKMTVAVIGCGQFAKRFVPLFQNHPYVEKVYVCDLIEEKAKEYAENFGVERIPTFEDVLADESIDSVAIFVQRHLHGPIVIRALEAGKNVYSAVPMASTVDECRQIVEVVKRTGKVYMMGETCIYYPCAMYCKEAYERGDFGTFVYGEAQYHHDLSHFSEYFRADRPASAVPPFLYPTHSTAMLLYALGDRVKRVTALGYKDKEPNTPFAVGENPWDNEFSNEFSLMELENGGVIRINECRRIGYKAPSSYISGFYGTKGAYQYANAQHTQTKLMPKGVELTDVSARVNPEAMTAAKEETGSSEEFKNNVANHKWTNKDFAPVQSEECARLPESYADLPNGHMGSHQFLIDDFCRAVHDGVKPTVDAVAAARYTVPGLIAHESARRGGVPMDVPDFGE